MFANTLNGDYSLLPNSPEINAADPALLLDVDRSPADIEALPYIVD
ncbi:MAG: hypothetical protein QGH20_02385 [Candidatus Latescibacteria bacterium]|jgi:hypothetical protein|nr:hypothetical protein [Candidatus Latescibacterota bacterium]